MPAGPGPAPFAAPAESPGRFPVLHGQDAGEGPEPVARLDASYTADLATVVDGRGDHGVFLGNARANLWLSLARAGLPGTHVLLVALADHGGSPSALVGDIQGLDNIESPHAVHLYEAWVEHIFEPADWSVLVGFYDLNSEFDVADAASVFINSSFGVGADLGESGRRGPSIFPTTSLGVRLRATPTARSYAQLAVLDGVPGPVVNGLPRVVLSRTTGALLVGEAGYLGPDLSEPGMPALPPAQLRRRRAGLGNGEAPAGSKLALGAWAYTGWLPRPGGAPGPMVHGSYGAYALGERWLYRRTGSHQGARAYARVGATAGRADPVRFFAGTALTWTGILQTTDIAGLGVAMAVASAAYRDALVRQLQHPGPAETALELTWRLGLADRFFLQPDIQLVLDPLAEPARGTAVFAGLRVEASF